MKEAKTNGNLLALAGTGAGTQEVVGGEIFSLPYLQSIYRNPMEPTTVRMRAAIECLPYENPKVSAVAISHMDSQSFAEALDRCIARSNSPPRLNGPVEELPASELKKPFSNLRRF